MAPNDRFPARCRAREAERRLFIGVHAVDRERREGPALNAPAPTRDGGRVPVVSVAGADKVYANGTRALAPVDLEIREGEFLTLLGPSGCGKTTLLNLIAGLIAPSAGTLRWWGGDFAATGGPGRRLGFVFQAPTLMPWARVTANVRLPLDLARVERSEAMREARAALALVGLSEFAAHL
ncbi:MAG TPA: ATP-binding cassette domain-containing protein, partial [Casimicrobiaceae bacterium]|nr:ATP-binding cassette domain-containing protein [Casimicrobiaceae bacterium]